MADEVPVPRLTVSFRKPDPYVEIDGTRKPLADYPDLQVTRQDKEIPDLLEVSMITGLVTRAHIVPGLVTERVEPLNNVRIKGAFDGDIYCTGWDPAFTLDKEGNYKRVQAKPDRTLAPGPILPEPNGNLKEREHRHTRRHQSSAAPEALEEQPDVFNMLD